MELSQPESREGLYDVYYTKDGDRLIVIEGLDPNDQVEHYPLQEFFLAHLDSATVFYWLLILAVSVYLLSMYIVFPLRERLRRTA